MSANENLPSSRRDAKAAIAKHYYTGHACSNGHLAPRFTSSGGCLECAKAIQKSDRARDYKSSYYRANGDVTKARAIDWKARNQDRSAVSCIAASHNARAKKFGVAGKLTADDIEFVLKRNDYRCVVCESQDNLNTDHIVSMCRGGLNVTDNMQTLCKSCNSQKHDSSMEEFISRKQATS